MQMMNDSVDCQANIEANINISILSLFYLLRPLQKEVRSLENLDLGFPPTALLQSNVTKARCDRFQDQYDQGTPELAYRTTIQEHLTRPIDSHKAKNADECQTKSCQPLSPKHLLDRYQNFPFL